MGNDFDLPGIAFFVSSADVERTVRAAVLADNQFHLVRRTLA